MALESLNSEFALKAISLTEKPLTSLTKRYLSLKESLFFNKHLGFWVNSVSRRPDVAFFGENQILSVFVASLVDRKLGKSELVRLKRSPFYITRNRWANYVDKNNKVKDATRKSETELLGILTEYLYNEKEAEVDFKQAQKDYFISESSTWKTYHRNAFHSQDNNQFYGIITTFLFDPEQAKDQYNLFLLEMFNQKDPWKVTSTFLLGVIAESLFDKDLAKERYGKEKKTPRLNKTNGYWEQILSEDNRVSNFQDTADQLLGIWCECLFEEPQIMENRPLVPLKRIF